MTGLCQCGCGRPTTRVRVKITRMGYAVGDYRRFIRGHSSRRVDATVTTGGYRKVAVGRAHKLEHVVVVERALGHPLRGSAPVHHVDEDRLNNANTNLVACDSQAYHVLLHRRMRALAASGHADWIRCHFCKRYDDPANMRPRRARQYVTAAHRACEYAYEKSRRAA